MPLTGPCPWPEGNVSPRLHLLPEVCPLSLTVEENKKVFLNPLRVPGWVWTSQGNRSIRKEHTDLMEFLHTHESLHKRMKTWRSDQSMKVLYISDKERINLWSIDKTGLGGLGGCTSGNKGWGSNWEGMVSLTKFVYTNYSAPNPLSLEIRISSFH